MLYLGSVNTVPVQQLPEDEEQQVGPLKILFLSPIFCYISVIITLITMFFLCVSLNIIDFVWVASFPNLQ